MELAKKGKAGRIILKMNALQDPTMINRLYEASQAGVEIDLIVRGICCLIPGQTYSRNIRVTRIVDTFLEHARIWYFGNGGNPKLFLGSPDWMRRNLYRRIEALPEQGRRIFRMICIEHKSYVETARLLSLSLHTVKTHMSRSFKALRKMSLFFFSFF